MELRGKVAGLRDDDGLGHLQADVANRFAEELAILGAPNGVEARADQLDAEVVQNPASRQLAREVQSRLAAERRQKRVRLLAPEDGCNRLEVERLDIRPVGEAWVGHDRRRVRVDDDGAETLGPKDFERLASCVVELAGLADD